MDCSTSSIPQMRAGCIDGRILNGGEWDGLLLGPCHKLYTANRVVKGGKELLYSIAQAVDIRGGLDTCRDVAWAQ